MNDQERLQEIEASIGMGVYTTPLGYKNTRFRLEDAVWLLSKVQGLEKALKGSAKVANISSQYVAELKDERDESRQDYQRVLELATSYRQAIEGAVAHFRQDEHPEGMALLEQALKGDKP